MKFSISQNGVVISSVYFNDNTIKEIVTFWTNVQYQSPQFALDLSPKTSSQLDQLYPNGLIPNISTGQAATIEVLTDSPLLQNIYIVEMQLIFVGIPDSSNSWSDHFDTATWAITPAGTAFLSPVEANSSSITITPLATQDPLDVSYKALVSFQIANDPDHTYFAIIDPLAKITTSTGSS
ncbi:MAG: hypothetical protein R8G66_22235 [Cytophagales bacterium]|nr:hypothetical protein [Cytophagales bacterium]